jgi:hypothetical protein
VPQTEKAGHYWLTLILLRKILSIIPEVLLSFLEIMRTTIRAAYGAIGHTTFRADLETADSGMR